MERGAGRKRVFDDRLDAPVKFGGLEPAPKHGNAPRLGQVEQLLRDFLPLGDEDAGEVEREEMLQPLAAIGGGRASAGR